MIKQSYKQLHVWEKSLNLSIKIYKTTINFPKLELYSLTSQMRRVAVSVPSNIAEGSQRSSDKDFARCVLIAKGSLAELETQIMISYQLKYINNQLFQELILGIDEVSKMLYSFYKKLSAVR